MLKTLIAATLILSIVAPAHAGPSAPPAPKPAPAHSSYTVDLTDVGISLTMPSDKWKTGIEEDEPVLNVKRPGYEMEMHVTLVTLPRVGGLEEELAKQRKIVMDGHPGTDVHVGAIQDYRDGRRGFEMSKDMPDRKVKLMVMIFAPAPKQPDKAVLILSIGDRPAMLKLRKAMRFIVESIRPLNAPWTTIPPADAETP